MPVHARALENGLWHGTGGIADLTPPGGGSTNSGYYANDTRSIRDKYQWPYSPLSYWNMPIGSNADYRASGIYIPADYGWKPNGYPVVVTDPTRMSMDPNDPIKTLTSTAFGTSHPVHVPASLTYSGGPNGCVVFLAQDNTGYWEGQQLDPLSAGGNPSMDWFLPNFEVNLTGDVPIAADGGSHGGSHMSALGGIIRYSDLQSGNPIRHALAGSTFGGLFYYHQDGGHRWPAQTADSAYLNDYQGSVPGMGMGTLLALKPDYNVDQWSNPYARLIGHAMQDFGMYIVDDTDVATGTWKVFTLDTEYGVDTLANWNQQAFHTAVCDFWAHTWIVDNNSPTSVGGGGTPRAPLAPAFAGTAPTSAGLGLSTLGTASLGG